MRCIFSCLGDKKVRKKPVAIPFKDQDHGPYETIKPIKMITVDGEKTKLPIIHSQSCDSCYNLHGVKHEDRQNGVVNERVASDFTNIKNAESERYSKEKKEEVQKSEQDQGPICQAHSDSSMSSLFSYPINNRYKDNSSRDNDHGFAQQESSDSLFSISVNSKKQSEKEEKEVNSPMKVRECPGKENIIIRPNRSGVLNPIEKITRLDVGNLEKLIMMDDQEEKENVKQDQETSLPISSQAHIFKQRSNLSGAGKETEIIRSNHDSKVDSIGIPIENSTQSKVGKLGNSILMDEQEDKENIKSEQDMFKQKSNLSEENKHIGSSHCVKTNSLLNPIENITQCNVDKSRRFNLMDDQEEKEKIISDQETRVPFTCQESSSFRNSSKFSGKKVKEVLVDTSLSSWLVESERESDSPKSVKNSPDRENKPLRRYNDDYNLNEKDKPIVGHYWKLFGVRTM